MGALQHLVVGGQQREALLLGVIRVGVEQPAAFLLVEIEQLPKAGDVGHFEIVDGELELVGQAHIAVGDLGSPLNVVDTGSALEKSREALQAVG